MNRHDRRAREARQRNAKRQQDPGARDLPGSFSVPLMAAEQTVTNCNPLPDDIKTDIAKTVRSVNWALMDGRAGGLCFFRAMSGWLTLRWLGIAARPALGGMLYRVGSDEHRDVVAFCGYGNAGALVNGHFVGHYFIVTNDDNVVDFSVGDWKALTGPDQLPDVEVAGAPKFGPIQWEIEDVPQFFWAPRASLAPVPGQHTPDLGRAWYTGFEGDAPDWDALLDGVQPYLINIGGSIQKNLEFFALKERVWAHQNGHTAVRLSKLAALATDHELAARALQMAARSELQDRLIVLRGQVELTPTTADELLAEGLAHL